MNGVPKPCHKMPLIEDRDLSAENVGNGVGSGYRIIFHPRNRTIFMVEAYHKNQVDRYTNSKHLKSICNDLKTIDTNRDLVFEKLENGASCRALLKNK